MKILNSTNYFNIKEKHIKNGSIINVGVHDICTLTFNFLQNKCTREINLLKC